METHVCVWLNQQEPVIINLQLWKFTSCNCQLHFPLQLQVLPCSFMTEKGNVFRFYLLLLTFHCVNVSWGWVTVFVTRHCRVPSSNNNMALGEKPGRPKPQYKDSTSLWWMWNETIPGRLPEPWEASCYGFADSQSSLLPSHSLIPGTFMLH